MDSHALEDATFARPRSPYVHSTMEDGHDFLLMSHLVDDTQPEISQAGNIVSGRPSNKVKRRQDGSSGYSYGETVTTSYGEESVSRGTSYGWSDDSTDPTSTQSSSIPLDAHILAYWPHSCSAALPFLCVAGEDDIFDLMSGLLYQRCAWGVVEPVIGVILSTTGYVGRVVLGWSEEAVRDPGVLPMVHFAYADRTRTDPSIGVYDLTDPASALKFAQFILSLRTHVEAVVAQCNQPVFKRLPWRSVPSMMRNAAPKNNGSKRSLIGSVRLKAVIPSLRRRHYPHFARVYLLALWPPDALHELLPELVLNQSIAITLGPGQLMTLTMSPLENVHAYSYSRAPTSLQLTLRQQIPFLPWMITVAVHKKGNQNLVGESIVQTPCLAPG